MKSKTVASIMRHVATKTAGLGDAEDASQVKSPSIEPTKSKKEKAKEGEEHKEGEEGAEEEEEVPLQNEHEEKRLEQLYEQIAWPLGDKYGHPYDAFKVALT